jgi:molybdopterin/thiamine biosynthesis adenylyltransferase
MQCLVIRVKGETTIAPTASIEGLSFEPREDRYSRQRSIAGWDQKALSKAKILVAGAGALGNEVLKNLALIGARHLLIVDFDRVEISNLSRTVLFDERDIGQPKASTAARALERLNPEIRVEAIDGDLETDIGSGEIRDCDLVLGCLDSIYARWALNRACQKAARPWINAGINASVGEISLYVPGKGPCYECGMTRQMWQQIHERRSCMLLRHKLRPATVPTTTIISSVTAALQVNEALSWLHGKACLSSGEMMMVSLFPYSLSTFTMTARQDCLAHDDWPPSIFIDARPADLTVTELLIRIPGAMSLQLDFDVLTGWLCRNCGEHPAIARLSASSAAQSQCPACKAERSPHFTHEISAADPLANFSLHTLGVPARSILSIKTESGHCYVELTGTRPCRSVP